MIDFAALAAPFPRDAVHWRGQKLTFKKDKALALAYLDARDVMDRLDEIAGPGNWQDSYTETPRGRVVCTISIRVGDEWVGKADGAGDTDVEGEKGGISDAFKRAAVKWGIGRYLYRMGQTWVPCDLTEQGKFKSFTDDPWKYVRNAPDVKARETARQKAARESAGNDGVHPNNAPKPANEPKSVIEIADEISAELDAIAMQYPEKSEPFYRMVQSLRQTATPNDYSSWESKNEQIYLSLTPAERTLIDEECIRQKDAIKASMKQAA